MKSTLRRFMMGCRYRYLSEIIFHQFLSSPPRIGDEFFIAISELLYFVSIFKKRRNFFLYRLLGVNLHIAQRADTYTPAGRTKIDKDGFVQNRGVLASSV